MKKIYQAMIGLSIICNSLTITSCQQPEKIEEKKVEESTDNVEKKDLELKQKELELKEAEIKLKAEALEREKETMYAVESAKKQKKFESAQECVVVTKRAYFYSQADPNTQRKAYLVNGDRCQPIKIQNSFIYIEFYNASSEKTTSGWISIDDLEVVY